MSFIHKQPNMHSEALLLIAVVTKNWGRGTECMHQFKK